MPAVAGPAAPQAREEAQREGPGPSGRERLAEEEGGESEGRLRPGVAEIVEGGQRGCPKDDGGSDHGTQAGLGDERVLLGEVPVRRQRAQATVPESFQRSVPNRPAQDDHSGVELRPELEHGAGVPAPLGQDRRRHLGARARRQ